MPQHHKVAPLSDTAFRLHMTAMAWSVEGKTDGRIPKAIPATLTRAPQGKKLTEALKELTEGGLWKAVDAAYEIHDFLQWNLSAADIAARSEAKSRAGASGGRRSGEARQKQAASTSEAPASAVLHVAAKTSEAKPKPLSQSLPDLGSYKLHSKDLTGSAQKSADLVVCDDESLGFQRRYELWAKNPGAFVLEDGHKRPEFLAVWFAWCRPFGITEGPVITQRVDTDVMAVVNAFASGKTLAQLLAVGKEAEKSPFIASLREQRKGGPSVFSAKVIRQMLADAGTVEPEFDPAIEAKAQQRLAREAERQQREIDAQTETARASLIARGIDPDKAPPFDLSALTARIG